MFTKKETIKSLTKTFYDWRITAKDYIFNLQHPAQRQLLSIDAADSQGKLNGMTVVEMLAIANLTAQTGEYVVMASHPANKSIRFVAIKSAPQLPSILR